MTNFFFEVLKIGPSKLRNDEFLKKIKKIINFVKGKLVDKELLEDEGPFSCTY